MAKYLSNTYTSTYTLTTNPTTVTSTGLIDVNTTIGYAGLLGPSGLAWAITNLGTVASVGGYALSGFGIDLLSGGNVTNGASGSTSALVQAVSTGVEIGGSAGTVANFGTIETTGTLSGTGVYLFAGGSVSNALGGTIAGGHNAIAIRGGAGTVMNSGAIAGTGPSGNTVYLASGGIVSNYGVITTAATPVISGTVTSFWSVINVRGQPGTVQNFGTILPSNTAFGVLLSVGGEVTNGGSGATSALISAQVNAVNFSGAAGIVDNSGTIEATGAFPAIFIGAGSTVTNNGLITGTGIGIDFSSLGGIAGNVTNFGVIQSTGSGTNLNALVFGAGGTVYNYGLISSVSAGNSANGYGSVVFVRNATGLVHNLGTIVDNNLLVGIDFISAGGTIVNGATNATSALISGGLGGSYIGGSLGVPTPGALGTVVNYGTIKGGRFGLKLAAGGIVTNLAGGLIDGGSGNAILTKNDGAALTVNNFGTLRNESSSSSTVYLGAGGSVTNGAPGATSALIAATECTGVATKYIAATITNFGTVTQAGTGTGKQAIYVGAGGTVTNFGLISGADPGSPASGGTGGYTGVITGKNQPVTVVNFGTIDNPNNSNGVNLLGGGLLINGSTSATSALINVSHDAIYIGGHSGVPIAGAIGTVVNYGTIENTTTLSNDVRLVSGGTVTNHGVISGARTGISFGFTAGAVDNFGAIVSTAPTSLTSGAGVYLQAGGLITNEAGGSITALRGAVSLGGTGTTSVGATVSNSGMLSGEVGISIGGFDSGDNIIDNSGTIIGTGGITVNLGAGNDSVVIEAGSTLVGAVGNFHPGDTFDLPFLSFDANDSVTLVSNGAVTNQLQVVGTGGPLFTIALDPNHDFSGDIFQLAADSGTGTLVTEQPVCFCRGTRIATERGEVAVEELAVGDRVMTLSGGSKPVRWIGFGRDLVTRRNSLARPIVVRAGALADNVPRRDLHLTHGHALFIDSVLIPVEHLVNHRSILWDESARVVEYYHIELDDHDVLFAEGAPAESYYDAGNRALFQNRRGGSAAGAAQPAFAPVLTGGERVERIWAGLFERAGGQIERDTTDDPDLHLIIDGKRLDAISRADGIYTFVLAAPSAGPLRLSSLSAVPSLHGLNRHEHRRLGVAIRQVVLHQPGVMSCFDHDAPLFLAGGCHAPEGGHSWTDGDFTLPADIFAHLQAPFTLIVNTRRQAMHYPISAALAAAA